MALLIEYGTALTKNTAAFTKDRDLVMGCMALLIEYGSFDRIWHCSDQKHGCFYTRQ